MKINVKRKKNKIFGRFAAIRLVIDGIDYGKIKSNQVKEIDLNNTSCSIKFFSSVFRSRPIRLRDGDRVTVCFDEKLDKDYAFLVLGVMGMVLNLIFTQLYPELWGTIPIKLSAIFFFILLTKGGISANHILRNERKQCIVVTVSSIN